MAAARVGKSKRLSGKGSVGVPSKTLQCEVCEIFVNSETQLSQVGLTPNVLDMKLQQQLTAAPNKTSECYCALAFDGITTSHATGSRSGVKHNHDG